MRLQHEPFTSGKHKVKIRVNLGAALKDVAEKIQVEKITVEPPAPVLSTFVDMGSQMNNNVLTPIRPTKIMGDLLKFDTADADQDIYFVSDKNKETKISMVIFTLLCPLFMKILLMQHIPSGAAMAGKSCVCGETAGRYFHY